MKLFSSVGSDKQVLRSVTVAQGNVHRNGATTDFIDNRVETIAQHRLMGDINTSPKMTAQRKAADSFHISSRLLAQRQQYHVNKNLASRFQAMSDQKILQSKFVSTGVVQLQKKSAIKPVNASRPDILTPKFDSTPHRITRLKINKHFGSAGEIIQRRITIGGKSPPGDLDRQVLEELAKKNVSSLVMRKAIMTMMDWITAPGSPPKSSDSKDTPSNVPLLSASQDKDFDDIPQLVQNLLDHIVAQESREYDEKVAWKVLEDIPLYLPLLNKMTSIIAENFNLRLKENSNIVRKYLQGKQPYGPLAQTQVFYDANKGFFDMKEFLNSKFAMEKFYKSFAMIHSYAMFLMKTGVIQRPDVKKAVGGSYRKPNSKYNLVEDNPEIALARKSGLSLWAGFSGSTADVLTLGKYFDLDQTEINQLALLVVTFFQIMPTDVTPTHTLHEVMTVANRLFNVPYKPFKLLPSFVTMPTHSKL